MFERKGYVDDAEFDWTGRTMSTPVRKFLKYFSRNNFLLFRYNRTRILCHHQEEDDTRQARMEARGHQRGARANQVVLTSWSTPDTPAYKCTGTMMVGFINT